MHPTPPIPGKILTMTAPALNVSLWKSQRPKFSVTTRHPASTSRRAMRKCSRIVGVEDHLQDRPKFPKPLAILDLQHETAMES